MSYTYLYNLSDWQSKMSKACLCFGDVKVVIRGVQVSMEAVCSIILLEKCLLFKIHLFHSCICSCSLQQFLADVVCLNGNQRLQKSQDFKSWAEAGTGSPYDGSPGLSFDFLSKHLLKTTDFQLWPLGSVPMNWHSPEFLMLCFSAGWI